MAIRRGVETTHEQPSSFGGTLITQYQAYAEANGIPVRLGHRAERVVLNDAGAVIGLEVAVTDLTAATPEARHFGSGGIGKNAEMMHHLMPAPTTVVAAPQPMKVTLCGFRLQPRPSQLSDHVEQVYFAEMQAALSAVDDNELECLERGLTALDRVAAKLFPSSDRLAWEARIHEPDLEAVGQIGSASDAE